MTDAGWVVGRRHGRSSIQTESALLTTKTTTFWVGTERTPRSCYVPMRLSPMHEASRFLHVGALAIYNLLNVTFHLLVRHLLV